MARIESFAYKSSQLLLIPCFKKFVILFLLKLFPRVRFWPCNSDIKIDCGQRFPRIG